MQRPRMQLPYRSICFIAINLRHTRSLGSQVMRCTPFWANPEVVGALDSHFESALKAPGVSSSTVGYCHDVSMRLQLQV